jgi:hypothetical protein
MNYKLIILPIISILFILIISCARPPLPECTQDKEKTLVVKWGKIDSATNALSGFSVDAQGMAKSLTSQNYIIQIDEKELGYVDGNAFCISLKRLRELIVKTQAMNFSGATARFIEYDIKGTTTHYIFQWNPDLKNNISRDFNDIFDSLEVLVMKYK